MGKKLSPWIVYVLLVVSDQSVLRLQLAVSFVDRIDILFPADFLLLFLLKLNRLPCPLGETIFLLLLLDRSTPLRTCSAILLVSWIPSFSTA